MSTEILWELLCYISGLSSWGPSMQVLSETQQDYGVSVKCQHIQMLFFPGWQLHPPFCCPLQLMVIAKFTIVGVLPLLVHYTSTTLDSFPMQIYHIASSWQQYCPGLFKWFGVPHLIYTQTSPASEQITYRPFPLKFTPDFVRQCYRGAPSPPA